MVFEHSYINGNYKVSMFSDGTKIRETEENEFIPSFSENVDVKITDVCDGGCPFCYEGCTMNGKHANLFSYPFINTLRPYTEMALNGNDLSHPDLEKFLIFLKGKKVYANITVNQKHFVKHYNLIKKWSMEGLIHGIGVSLNTPCDDFIEMVASIPNTVIHTINGILTNDDVNFLKDKGLKVLILGYKSLRRGEAYKESCAPEIKRKQDELKSLLPAMINEEWFDVLSFDNLAIEQLDVKSLLPPDEWDSFYMGDDGDYTFYIDMVKGEYGRNSISSERFPIGDKSIDEMFRHIKKMKTTL